MTEVSHQGKEDASIRHDAVTRESFLCDRARFLPASAANYSRERTTTGCVHCHDPAKSPRK